MTQPTLLLCLAASWLVPVTALAQESPAPAITPERIEVALHRYRREPEVERVIAAAWRARSASPSRVHDAMNRARGTGWLPTARTSIRRGQTVDLRGLTGDTLGTPTNVSTDDALTFEATLTFRLDRIVFASEEVPMLRELRSVELERSDLARVIVHLYFERRRLQLERDLAGLVDVPRALRILEIEALLDAFTEGSFTRMMGGRSTDQDSPP